MFAPTINWGAGLQGYRAGKSDRMAEDKQNQAMALQKEAERRMEQTQQMMMHTQSNANYEMDALKKALEEQKANTDKWKKATLNVDKNKALNDYVGSLKPDAFTSDKFSGDITKIQDFSRIVSPDKKPPKIPNMDDDTQVRQIYNLLKHELGDKVADIDGTELWNAAKKLGLSGEYISVGEHSDTVVPVQQVFGAIGAQMNHEAQQKFNAFTRMKHQLALASAVKKDGDGSTTDQGLQLYKQIQADKKLRDDLVEKGEKVPDALNERITHNQNIYQKNYVSSSAAASKQGNRDEYNEILKMEQEGKTYKGAAEDVQHFNSLQIKDKQKSFEAVQKEVTSFRTFRDTKKRINDILSQADIDRDAVSNLGFKVQQYLGTDAGKLVEKIKGGGTVDPNELLRDKKAMAAFNRIETATGFPMVMLIKEISGAAVTNEEREYLMNLVIGGEFKNMDALTEKMDEFVNTLGNKAIKSLNKQVTGGKALRPNWGSMVENEIKLGMSSGKVGSTLDLNTESTQGQGSQSTVVDKAKEKAEAIRKQAQEMLW